MTTTHTGFDVPAVLGGRAEFPDGLALMEPTLPDRRALERRLASILASGQLTNGRTVRELEERVAERLHVPHVVAVSSCTSGLALTYQALGVHGQVVLPSFTFSASAHAVTWASGTPLFTDVAPDTLCLDPEAVAAEMGGVGAVSATHIYGTPCRTEELEAIAASADVPLVFDAAHALGSVRSGRPVGSFGTAEVFSLSPTKVVVGGEGGLVSTRDGALAEAVRLGRNYGNPGNYDCEFPGLNARMSELHAAVALHSLSQLDQNVQRRNELAELFWTRLSGLTGLTRPRVDTGDVSTYKDLTLLVDPVEFGLSSVELAVALGAEGIDTRRYYHPPIHSQAAYRSLPRRRLPVTERVARCVLSVPLWSHMTLTQMNSLANAILRVHDHRARIRHQLPERIPR